MMGFSRGFTGKSWVFFEQTRGFGFAMRKEEEDKEIGDEGMGLWLSTDKEVRGLPLLTS